MVETWARHRRAPIWVGLLTLAVLIPVAVLGGIVAAVVVVLLGVQGVVAAARWPEVGRAARWTLTRGLPLSLGWMVVVVAVDAGVGALINRMTGDEPDHGDAVLDLASVDLPPTGDPRVDAPAYEDSPWADRLLAEMEELDYDYVPFIGPRVAPVRGRYITSSDGIRASYGDDADGPVVWFFGGSTMWGEGQRDDHTIPSEVARLAEADGRPVRVVNYGERGYTAYQELLLFEQELAEHGPPDLAVFYDGVNEVGTQQETPDSPSAQPTLYQYETTLDALRRAPALPGSGAPAEPSLATEYVETSALHKVLRALDLVGTAGAQDQINLEAVAENAYDIYDRSVAMIRDLARRHGVTIVSIWQPVRQNDLVNESVAERLPTGVVQLPDAFRTVADEDTIFIDGAHMNEVGSRLVAEAMWPMLARRLDAGGSG